MAICNVIIPAFEPDNRLVALVEELVGSYGVIVVDDGSGEDFRAFFECAQTAGATVLTHAENRGKGAALKTAIAYLKEAGDELGAITADSDGQHTAEDIAKLAERMDGVTFITGGRDFSQMPPRSKFGNTVTRAVFKLATGLKLSDTQTGLRAFPAAYYDRLLKVEGDRYEYEMNVLLALRSWDVPYEEIPISTIYIEGNSSSHFHPVKDGLRVFSRVIKYSLSSLACFLIDYGIYWALLALGILPAVCYAGARIVSGTINYQLCRRVVFKSGSSHSAIAYFGLALFSMTVGSLGVTLLTSMGAHGVLSKLILDAALFVFNYVVQKKFVFKTKAV